MAVGKLIRMNRLFAYPSGRLCSIAKAVIHEGKPAQEALHLAGL